MHSYRPLVCGPRSSRDGAFARLITHLRTPLYRNGYALVLSSATTSVLGVAYWILAARTYTPDGRDQMIMIGEDRYFVLGDNRNISEDSRYYGSVRREQIVGVITR